MIFYVYRRCYSDCMYVPGLWQLQSLPLNLNIMVIFILKKIEIKKIS